MRNESQVRNAAAVSTSTFMLDLHSFRYRPISALPRNLMRPRLAMPRVAVAVGAALSKEAAENRIVHVHRLIHLRTSTYATGTMTASDV